jgi:hypothetical protein
MVCTGVAGALHGLNKTARNPFRCFDNRGERSSLAQGEQVAGCVNGPEHSLFSLAGA